MPLTPPSCSKAQWMRASSNRFASPARSTPEPSGNREAQASGTASIAVWADGALSTS